jgi:hypothetical protein
MPPRRLRTIRLRDVVPRKLARLCVRQLAREARRIVRVLRPTYAIECIDPQTGVSGTDLYKTIEALADFAVHGELLPGELDAVLARLAPLRCCEAVLGSLEPAEPVTELEAVIVGARARAALESGEALTSIQVAILAGLDRDHVNGLAKKDEIPGAERSNENGHRPWRFRNSKALREWIDWYAVQ